MLLSRRAFSLFSSLRAPAVYRQNALGSIRLKSGKSVDEGEKEESTAQEKLDELADFLENQRKENTGPSRSSRRHQEQSGSNSFRGPTKIFQSGDYYDPITLSPQYMRYRPRRTRLPLLGPSKHEAMKTDPFHILSLNPSKPSLADDSYKNGAILSQYISEMGKILPRNITGLTRKSQRYVGKAIRRARAMGILPVLSRGKGRGSTGWS